MAGNFSVLTTSRLIDNFKVLVYRLFDDVTLHLGVRQKLLPLALYLFCDELLSRTCLYRDGEPLVDCKVARRVVTMVTSKLRLSIGKCNDITDGSTMWNPQQA